MAWNFRHKYRAIPTEIDGNKFPSKKEAHYFQKLGYAKQAGELLLFLRQVPFHLPGGVIYRCDFMEFWANGEIRFVDVKGFKTQEYINKKKMVEELYAPIKIMEV